MDNWRQELCLVFQKTSSDIINVFIYKDEFIALGGNFKDRINALRDTNHAPQALRGLIGISYKLINIISLG
jgi:hypothetical protein